MTGEGWGADAASRLSGRLWCGDCSQSLKLTGQLAACHAPAPAVYMRPDLAAEGDLARAGMLEGRLDGALEAALGYTPLWLP